MFINLKYFFFNLLLINVLTSVAEPEPVETKLFLDLEPEPKINFNKQFLQSVLSSVVDPDPHGSGTFAWILIRNYSSGSGSSKK